MTSSYFDGFGDSLMTVFKDTIEAIFEPVIGDTETVEIIFNACHQEVDIDGVPYGAEKPVAWFKTGVITPKDRDKIVINTIEYIIRDVKPDGLELTELTLSKAVN